MITEVHIDRWRTRLGLVVRSGSPLRREPLHAALVGEVDRLELLASRFRDDSEVTVVNRSAGSWVDVSWDFVEVLTASLDAARDTDGLVTPLLGRHVDAAGYRSWRDEVPVVATDPGPAPDWQSVEIRPVGSSAQLRIPGGSALDLGAVAKAWLADRMSRLVFDICSADVIADMGGDLSIRTAAEPWQVAVDPGPHGDVQHLLVGTSGLATSGTSRRTWRTADGQQAHHIIDPRTGRPAEVVWSGASVLAGDARGANTAATAAVILGHEAPGWITTQNLDARLTGPDADIRVGRWPAADDRENAA